MAKWNRRTSYQSGEIVDHIGRQWIAQTASTNVIPGQDFRSWTLANANLNQIKYDVDNGDDLVDPDPIQERRPGVGFGEDSSGNFIIQTPRSEISTPLLVPPPLPSGLTTLIPGHNEYSSSVVDNTLCRSYSFVQFASFWFDDEPLDPPDEGNEMSSDYIRDLWTDIVSQMVLNSLQESGHKNGKAVCIDIEDTGVDRPLTAQDMSYNSYLITNSTRFNKFPYYEDRDSSVRESFLNNGGTFTFDTPASEALPRAAYAVRTVTQRVLEKYPNSPVGWYNIGINAYIPGEEGIENADLPALQSWMSYLKAPNPNVPEYRKLYTRRAFDHMSFCFLPIYPGVGNQWPNPAFAGKHYYKRFGEPNSKLGNFLNEISTRTQNTSLRNKIVPGFTSRWIYTGDTGSLVTDNKTWSQYVTEGAQFSNSTHGSPNFLPVEDWQFQDYTAGEFAVDDQPPSRIPMLPREAKEFYGWLGYESQKNWQTNKPTGFSNMIWGWWDGDIMPSVAWKGKEISWVPRVAWSRGTLENNFRNGNIDQFMRTVLSSGYKSYLESDFRPQSRAAFSPEDLVWFDSYVEKFHRLFHYRGSVEI